MEKYPSGSGGSKKSLSHASVPNKKSKGKSNKQTTRTIITGSSYDINNNPYLTAFNSQLPPNPSKRNNINIKTEKSKSRIGRGLGKTGKVDQLTSVEKPHLLNLDP